jgi:thioredoxin-related protein
MKRLTVVVAMILLAVVSGCQQSTDEQQARSPIYDESADARQDIEAAIAEASRNGKHILLMFGGNWCGWCHALHGLFQSHQEISRLLEQRYVLVMVDVGNRDKNLDLDERYGNPYRHGFPVLVVLDAEGRQLAVRETGGLERQDGGRGHDPDKVLSFLERWAPSPTTSAAVAGEWRTVDSPTQASLRGLCLAGSDAAWASGSDGSWHATNATDLHTVAFSADGSRGLAVGADGLIASWAIQE